MRPGSFRSAIVPAPGRRHRRLPAVRSEERLTTLSNLSPGRHLSGRIEVFQTGQRMEAGWVNRYTNHVTTRLNA
jgi:hypothetical protein